jgi:DNA-binding NarL/FixJ family response regulator
VTQPLLSEKTLELILAADSELQQSIRRVYLALLEHPGSTDAAIARHLGISQQTVERRIRAILDLLGVTTRFQAGVQAGRRNWI